MSKTMNIGIDHGYYAIKTRHFSFPAGIAEYSHEPYTLQNTLEFGGKFYVCGTGRQPILRNKMENDNYYLLTLAAIAKEIKQRGGKTECSVRIAAGLPLAGFGREKKPFREYLLRSSQPVCFKFEGIAYKITIEDVKLFPQGYSAIALHSELIQNEPSVLLMDIGGWTVDLMRLDNGRGYSLSSSLPAPFGGYSTDKFTELRINDLTAFRTAYCIQLGVATHTGIGYDQSDDYAALTMEQKAMINTALTLGYNVETGTKYGGSAMDEYIATQILIWLIAHGQLGTGYENQIVNEITANSPAAKTIFQKLRENVVTYHTVPSFATDNPSAVGAYTHDLKYNEDTGKNETTLVDENNVLKDFSVSYPGVDFSISGNKLHVSTDKKEFGTITAEKELPSSIPGVVTGGTKYWLRDEYQNVVTFDVKGSAEPVKCYFSLEIKAGTLQLVKTSEDGEVSGIPFHISGNGIEKDVVTGPDGSIRVDNLQAGTYTVTERAPDKYVQPESKQVTIYPGQTSSVSFSNLLKKFTVKLDKVDSETEEAQGDSSLDGALYGMFKGENLLDTYTTANGGKFTTKEYPCGSDYTIREITPSEGYLLDETIYPVGAEPGNFTLENNSIPMTATEDVILGSIASMSALPEPKQDNDRCI